MGVVARFRVAPGARQVGAVLRLQEADHYHLPRHVLLLTKAAKVLLPLGRRCPKGRMRGPCGAVDELPPHQFGRMPYNRAMTVAGADRFEFRDRKSWPHVPSPRERGSFQIQVLGEAVLACKRPQLVPGGVFHVDAGSAPLLLAQVLDLARIEHAAAA